MVETNHKASRGGDLNVTSLSLWEDLKLPVAIFSIMLSPTVKYRNFSLCLNWHFWNGLETWNLLMFLRTNAFSLISNITKFVIEIIISILIKKEKRERERVMISPAQNSVLHKEILEKTN